MGSQHRAKAGCPAEVPHEPVGNRLAHRSPQCRCMSELGIQWMGQANLTVLNLGEVTVCKGRRRKSPEGTDFTVTA